MPSADVDFSRFDQFAADHHGLITRARFEALGGSRAAWYRAITARRIEQVHPNVARLIGSPETFEQRALAAVWAAGPGAMASHRTAAALWGIARPEDDPIDVILTARTREASLAGVIVHRPRDRTDLRPVVRRNVPATNPLRMLLDLGAVDPDAVPDALVQVLSTKAASPAAVRSAIARHSRRGRHGITALRAALESWLEEELPPDSVLEARVATLLQRHGLEAQFHARVAGYEVDFLVIGTKVVIECDGWGTHGLLRDQFEFDRVRNAELVAAGYVIVPVTWRQLQHDPSGFVQRLLAALRQWAPERRW